jgi:hypothetical protein
MTLPKTHATACRFVFCVLVNMLWDATNVDAPGSVSLIFPAGVVVLSEHVRNSGDGPNVPIVTDGTDVTMRLYISLPDRMVGQSAFSEQLNSSVPTALVAQWVRSSDTCGLVPFRIPPVFT